MCNWVGDKAAATARNHKSSISTTLIICALHQAVNIKLIKSSYTTVVCEYRPVPIPAPVSPGSVGVYVALNVPSPTGSTCEGQGAPDGPVTGQVTWPSLAPGTARASTNMSVGEFRNDAGGEGEHAGRSAGRDAGRRG